MVQQTFPVTTRRPRVAIRYIDGNLDVRSWDRPEISVETAEPIASLRYEGETLTINDYKGDITMWVPSFKNGFFSFATRTHIVVSNLSRSATIEGVGDVELREIGGSANLRRIHGNVELVNIREVAEAQRIEGNLHALHTPILRVQDGVGGNATLSDIQSAELDAIGGNLYVERIERALHVRVVGGNGNVYDCPRAEIAISSAGGNLHVDTAALMLSSSVGGNLDVRASFPASAHTRLRAGGNITVALPVDASLSVHGTAGGNISAPTINKLGGGFVNLVYGTGQARLDVAVGGNLRFLGDAVPSTN